MRDMADFFFGSLFLWLSIMTVAGVILLIEHAVKRMRASATRRAEKKAIQALPTRGNW